ncbi:MAG: ATP-binding cassette domain-containing protein [Candidatus Dormibacteria bacterium]
MNLLTTTTNLTSAAVSASGLRKVYGKNVVLAGVDLTIRERQVFSLLGPNGAGKTTIVRILPTLIRADAGPRGLPAPPRQTR